MTRMNSTRYSKLVAWGFVAMLALSVAVPVAAVSVETKSVPSEAQVGSTYSANVTFTDLYSDNQEWQLNATTELENDPLWTLELIDVNGETTTVTRTGQNVTFSDTTISSPVSKVRVTVEGEVPAVANYSYADEETFTAMAVSQMPVTSDGSTGAASSIETFSTHHYTNESKTARDAIDEAAAAIAEAEEAGADTTAAEDSFDDAKAFYRNDDFQKAISNAEEATQQAEDAMSSKESSEQTTQLVIYGVIALVVIGLIGGGYYWYKQNQQDTSRLG